MFNMITIAESYYPGLAEKVIAVNRKSLFAITRKNVLFWYLYKTDTVRM